jgi:hypothetical protein
MYEFNPYSATELCQIMGNNGSDKGSRNIKNSWHNYTTFYYFLFNKMKDRELRVFELGLGTNDVSVPSNMGRHGKPGASLFGWREFFPKAMVYGADIDKKILFNSDRIQTFYCDQTNPEIIKTMWDNKSLEKPFDIIVEDGLHTFNANVCFFENSIHKLAIGGYYIIEDIRNGDQYSFMSKIKEWELRHTDCSFKLLNIPSSKNNCDNTLLIILKH